MTAPRFSIVIPTRERPHTLEHTLATCLAQEGDFEVVVSDNWSAPRTRELVEGRGDARVRYVRTPELLAMTDSLEFAVAHARGAFVIIQGDDDGLLRHALTVIDRVLRATRAAVLRWDSAVYNWPDVSNAHFQPNALLLPLAQTRTGHALHECDARRVIGAAANGRVNYSELPVIYNAVIRRDLFDQLRARTGRVFKTRTPDVYTAFAVAALVETYHSLRAPLGICGRSGASTGVARHFSKKGSPIDNEFRRLNTAAGLNLHPWVPDLPPIASAVADAFLWAKHELFPGDADTTLDRQQLVRNCLREMEIDSAEEWDDARASFRHALVGAPELLAWFEHEYGSTAHTALPRPNRSHHWKRYGEGHLHLDTSEFGTRNIDQAADLCERLLGYKRDGLNFNLQAQAHQATALSELQEKEAQVQQLHVACGQLQNQLRESSDAFWLRINGQDVQIETHVREKMALQDRVAELDAKLRVYEQLLREYEQQAQRSILRRIANRVLPRRAG